MISLEHTFRRSFMERAPEPPLHQSIAILKSRVAVDASDL